MGENEVVEANSAVASAPATIDKLPGSKEKKKDKKLVSGQDVMSHLTGRLLTIDVGAAGVGFSVKGKKGKAETFTLKGMEPATVPAAAAVLVGLLDSKLKVRIEYVISEDNNSRIVKSLRTHV